MATSSNPQCSNGSESQPKSTDPQNPLRRSSPCLVSNEIIHDPVDRDHQDQTASQGSQLTPRADVGTSDAPFSIDQRPNHLRLLREAQKKDQKRKTRNPTPKTTINQPLSTLHAVKMYPPPLSSSVLLLRLVTAPQRRRSWPGATNVSGARPSNSPTRCPRVRCACDPHLGEQKRTGRKEGEPHGGRIGS